MRKVVGARELKTRLGRYLRAVRRGATIVVSDRGEPIAELRPISHAADAQQSHLERRVALGLISPGSGEPLAAVRAIRVRGKPVAETVIDGREERL